MSDTPKTINIKNNARSRPRYDLVFIFLIIFTALEVATSYLQSNLKVPALILLSVIKASLVVLYFMHLKFDSRIFTILFVLGLAFVVPILLMMTLVMPGL
jgi:cytochrome c oxidase subunit IV